MTTATGIDRQTGAAAVPSRRGRTAPSARVRILGWYVVLLAVAIGLGLWLQRSLLLDQVDDDINAELRQEAEELEQLVGGLNPATGQPFGGDVEALFNTFLSRNLPVQGEALFTLIDGEPHASTVTPLQLLDDPEAVAEWAAIDAPATGELQTEMGPVRYLAVPVVLGGETAGTFVAASFLDQRRGDVNDVLRVGALVFGSAFVVASLAAWVAAGRILRPVQQLTDAARTVTDSNWTERIAVQGDDQIAELARTFNEMLDRLEDAFATQRTFIDDAGHELRTPITIIRGHLELMGDDPQERRETMHLVMDELDRMARMVEDLLLLAKAETPDFLDLHPFDVAELTRDLAVKAPALAERNWVLAESADVVLVADRQRLTQAMMNLLRNAAEHSQPGSRITLGSRAGRENVTFWVADEGEGIAEAEQERIFDRFARGRAARRSEGAGLGLAIVRAIAEAHGGRVALRSQPGQGARFALIIPAEPREEHTP